MEVTYGKHETLGMDLPTAFRMFMKRSKMVKGLPFEATLPETTITRVEAKNAFYELREQAADIPEECCNLPNLCQKVELVLK